MVRITITGVENNRKFLQENIDRIKIEGTNGVEILRYCIRHNLTEFIAKLLLRGVDPYLKDANGWDSFYYGYYHNISIERYVKTPSMP